MRNTDAKNWINITFSELSYSVPKDKGKKNILKGVSGRFLSGQISAILGPSGAGKTTLMNILAGYKISKTSGGILINGKQSCIKSLGQLSCYIKQEEYLLQFLTVQESMEAAATLKLGNNKSEASKKDIIDQILSSVGLANCKNTRVGNLSGGEKKRLSIAFELINKPPVMFFDEPTSGLDSHSSYQCIVLLRKLALEGRTIICTIHQPSARLFETFDYVYALAEGQCVYMGSVPGLLPFMASISLQCPSYHNPADLLIEVASGEYGNFINTLVEAVNGCLSHSGDKSNSTGKAIELDLVSGSKELTLKISEDQNKNQGQVVICTSKEDVSLDLSSCSDRFLPQKTEETFAQYSVSFWMQFRVLFLRTFRSIWRDKFLTLFRLTIHIFLGIFVGFLFYDIGNEASDVLSNMGYIFFSILFYVILSVVPTIITFPSEMKVLVREHLNHWYSLKSYYLAKTLADTPFQIVFSLMFISTAYFMTSQTPEIARFSMVAVLGILNTLVSQSIGLIVGAAFDIQHAVFVAPVVVIPPILISGMFIKISAMPIYLRWLTYISYVKYCYEGTFKITYGYERKPLHCSKEFCLFKHPKKVIEQFDVEETDLWIDILVLVVFFFVIRFLGYFIMRWKIRRERG